jgi:hypothetical protein
MKDRKKIRQAEVRSELESAERRVPLLNDFRENLQLAVKPLFKHRNWSGPLELIGSGVLVSFDKHVFVFTAAHVLEHFDGHEVHMPVAGQIVGVKGYSHRSKRPKSGTHDDDPIDVGILYVDEGPVCRMLHSEAITLDDLYMANRDLEQGLVLLGHPLRTFVRHGDSAHTKLTLVRLEGEPKTTYQRLGFSTDDHILLRYSKRCYTDGKNVATPSMRGMSGGGVWVLPHLTGRPWPPGTLLSRPRLVGIFIELRRTSAVYVAVNVFFYFLFLGTRYPSVRMLLDQEAARADSIESQKEYEQFIEAMKDPSIDYVLYADRSEWNVLCKSASIILNVHSTPPHSKGINYHCRVAMKGPGPSLDHRELERIKAEAILLVERKMACRK